MKKIVSLLAALALVLTMIPAVMAETTETYIPGVAIDEAKQGPTEYVEPKFYPNGEGEPTIGVTLVGVIVEDGKYFKDSNNDGKLDAYEDWRLPVEERVADLLTKMTPEQRIGLLQNQLMLMPAVKTGAECRDENGNVDFGKLITITPDAINEFNKPKEEAADTSVEGEDATARIMAMMGGAGGNTVFNSTGIILGWENRSGVVRSNMDVESSALWTNALGMTTEYAAVAKNEPTIPFTIISNPINPSFAGDSATNIPGSQGVAAAAMADGNYDLIEKWADLDGKLWNLKGISRMYGPQIDLITDPRWNRDSGTYTERPEVNAGIAAALVKGYQGEKIEDGSVLLFIKHFPGDGSSYNGFESHNKIGEWRLYPTEGSLEKYQLVGFQAAIDAGLAGIMPGYSRPCQDARSAKQTYRGVEINAPALANAYNKEIIGTLLRDTMGFTGMINTDSGVFNNGMQYGMEDTDLAVRAAALINGGSDVVGDGFSGIDNKPFMDAYEQGLYEDGALDRANGNTLKVLFEMGQFENPYTDVAAAMAEAETIKAELEPVATEIDQKSVVLMKNSDKVLPLTDTTKKVYIASYTVKGSDDATVDAWKAAFEAEGFTVVSKAAEADIAFLSVVPGGVSNSNKFMNVIDLVDGLEVPAVDHPNSFKRTGETTEATTLMDVKKIKKTADTVHENGGKVVVSLNISNPWILTNLEPYADAIVGEFSTSKASQMNVIMGRFAPVGKLPITMVSCNEVIATYEKEIDGTVWDICVSPNDVPGYDKDQYISAEVLAQSPSGSYAYKDADGNMYVSGFGLSY